MEEKPMKNILQSLDKKKAKGEMAYAGISAYYERWCSGDPFYEQTKEFYMRVLPTKEGPFLELGIGTGRLARLLIQHQAVEVTGIDVCKEMLAICKTKYEQQKEAGCLGRLFLEQGDMTNLQYFEQFGTIYLPFRTVGHLLTDKHLEAMFQGVYRALKPGGIFLLDHYMFDREWAVQNNNKDLLMYSDNSTRIEDHYNYHFEKGYMDCAIKVNGVVVDQFQFRWCSKDCIGNAAKKVGFSLEVLMGEFDGSAWNEQSGNQIWVWRK